MTRAASDQTGSAPDGSISSDPGAARPGDLLAGGAAQRPSAGEGGSAELSADGATYGYPTGGVHRNVADYVRALPRLDGQVVIDVPAGDGRTTYEFLRRGATVRPFDLYPEFMRLPGVETTYADLSDGLPVEDACANWVMCQEGLEHLPDQLAALREFNRVLEPGGRLLLTVPSISHMRARLSSLLVESEFWKRMPPSEIDGVWFTDGQSDRVYFGHVFLIGVQKLQTLATVAGFDVEQRVRTRLSGTSVVMGVLLYPLLALFSLASYFLYRDRNDQVDRATRHRILWERVKLNLAPQTLFGKHVFWVLVKRRDEAESLEHLRDLTRRGD